MTTGGPRAIGTHELVNPDTATLVGTAGHYEVHGITVHGVSPSGRVGVGAGQLVVVGTLTRDPTTRMWTAATPEGVRQTRRHQRRHDAFLAVLADRVPTTVPIGAPRRR